LFLCFHKGMGSDPGLGGTSRKPPSLLSMTVCEQRCVENLELLMSTFSVTDNPSVDSERTASKAGQFVLSELEMLDISTDEHSFAFCRKP